MSFLALAMTAVTPASAKGPRVWIALSGGEVPYLEAAKAVREGLPDYEVTVRPWSEFVAESSPAPRVIVTLGVEAMHRMVQSSALWPKVPVVALLVPRASLERLVDETPGRLTGIYFDQPFARQMQFLRLAMPGKKRVGILLGPGSRRYQGEIRQAVRRAGLEEVIELVDDKDDLPPRLRDVLEKSDVLVAVPDTAVHNNHTAHHVLMASYRRGVPLIGYSSSFVKAGAAAALVSTPDQIGGQGADLVARLVAGGDLPEPRAPEEFEVMINDSVSRSLDLSIDADYLARKLGARKGGA